MLTEIFGTTVFSRHWAMPSSHTFSLWPMVELLDRVLAARKVVVDPFARNSRYGTITNDLNPQTRAQYHLDAADFCALLFEQGVVADAVLFDPPYSPRQISELYQQIGRTVTTEDTQNAALYRSVKEGLDRLLRPGGFAVSCGWNSVGFGVAYELLEVHLIVHGAAHNDTIVTVERKLQGGLFDSEQTV